MTEVFKYKVLDTGTDIHGYDLDDLELEFVLCCPYAKAEPLSRYKTIVDGVNVITGKVTLPDGQSFMQARFITEEGLESTWSNSVRTVPEPDSITLLAVGIIMLGVLAARRWRP